MPELSIEVSSRRSSTTRWADSWASINVCASCGELVALSSPATRTQTAPEAPSLHLHRNRPGVERLTCGR